MCSSPRRGARRPRQAGFTLIDAIIIIVVIGTVAGAMTVLFARLGAQTAQTMRTAQALAFAEGLLNEVRAQPMSYCDPQDARARLASSSAVGGAGCATQAETLGPEGAESRYGAGAATRLDNVGDYQGLTLPGPGCVGGLCDRAGNLLSGPAAPLAGCSARVATTPQAMPGIAALDANGRPQGLRITVTVRCPGLADSVVEGIRLRHSPNRV
jgi:type II secretory pathway pseudopilin PulG